MSKEIGAVFVGYGLGIMQFADDYSRILFAIPMLIGMFFIGIDIFKEEKRSKKKKRKNGNK